VTEKLTYKRSGVDIDRANRFVETITPLIKTTFTEGSLGDVGHFGGFFKANFAGMKEPVLVSSTDGVGTKLLVAVIAKKFDTVGTDLVAMCVNDVVACGARPLFFLDYFAMGRLSPRIGVEVLKGIAGACRETGCALIGGETAELPGLYEKDEFDLAGFCVGVADKKDILDGKNVRPGDRIIGLASTGIHSNGYSLVRKVFSQKEMKGRYKRQLLKPTALYVRPILDIIGNCKVKAAAHITGGGFYDNIPRILPNGTAVSIEKGSWMVPPIFDVIQKRAKISDGQMYRTFNMGIGMAVIVPGQEAATVIKRVRRFGIEAWDIGEVIKWAKKEVII